VTPSTSATFIAAVPRTGLRVAKPRPITIVLGRVTSIPPTQAKFTSAPNVNGWASYKVAENVTSHEAFGLGIYSVFRHPDVRLTRAIEVPTTPGVRFHHMITVALGNLGSINNVINNTGGATQMNPRVTPQVTHYP